MNGRKAPSLESLLQSKDEDYNQTELHRLRPTYPRISGISDCVFLKLEAGNFEVFQDYCKNYEIGGQKDRRNLVVGGF